MKKEYIKPEMYIVIIGDNILDDVIPQGSDTNVFEEAKENSIDFGDDIDSDEPYRDLWED